MDTAFYGGLVSGLLGGCAKAFIVETIIALAIGVDIGYLIFKLVS